MNSIVSPTGKVYSRDELDDKYNNTGTSRPLDAKYALGIVKAHAKLGSVLANPKTYVQVAKGYRKGKGIVLPGSRYIGPFNPLPDQITEEWLPKTPGDYSAYLHDRRYGMMIDAGYRANDIYLGYSRADEEMIGRAKQNLDDYQSLVGLYGIGAKQVISKTGLTSSTIGFE